MGVNPRAPLSWDGARHLRRRGTAPASATSALARTLLRALMRPSRGRTGFRFVVSFRLLCSPASDRARHARPRSGALDGCPERGRSGAGGMPRLLEGVTDEDPKRMCSRDICPCCRLPQLLRHSVRSQSRRPSHRWFQIVSIKNTPCENLYSGDSEAAIGMMGFDASTRRSHCCDEVTRGAQSRGGETVIVAHIAFGRAYESVQHGAILSSVRRCQLPEAITAARILPCRPDLRAWTLVCRSCRSSDKTPSRIGCGLSHAVVW